MQGGPSGFVSGDPYDVDFDGETEVDEESKGFSDTMDERGDDPYLGPSEVDWADVGEMMGADDAVGPARPLLHPREREVPAYDKHQAKRAWKDAVWTRSDWRADWVLRNYGIDREGNLVSVATAVSSAEERLNNLPDYDGPSGARGGDVSANDIFPQKFAGVIVSAPPDNSRKWTNVTLPVSELIPCQDFIPREGLRTYISNPPTDLPLITKMDGKYYVAAGTTRIGAAILRGETAVKVRLVEWDGRYWNKVTSSKVEPDEWTFEVKDTDGQLEELFDAISHASSIGHSFEVVMDPDDPEYRQEFFIDGDGGVFLDKTASAVVTDEDSEPMEEYDFQGLPIVVENKAGTYRTWQDQSGKSGKTKMVHDYGYIDGYHGVDGDEVDVYTGPNDKSEWVFIVHQMNSPEFKDFDEDKVMLGFDSEEDAKKAYLKHYDNQGFYGGMTSMKMDAFKKTLDKNATEKDPSALTHLVGEAMKTANRPDIDLGDGTNNRRKSPETVTLVGNGAEFTVSKGQLPSGYQGDNKQVCVAMESVGMLVRANLLDDFSEDELASMAEDSKYLLESDASDEELLGELIYHFENDPGFYFSRDQAIEFIEDYMDHGGKFDDVRALLGMTANPQSVEPAANPELEELVDTQQELAPEAASSNGKMGKRANVGREERTYKQGDKVIYKPSGRKGKVTKLNAHVATVEFDDGLNPSIRNCFTDDLAPATGKTAAKRKKLARGLSVLKQLYEQVKSGTDDETEMAEKEAFYLSENMFGYTLSALITEANGKTRNYDADLPESVVRQTIRTLEDKQKKRDLSLEEESDYGLLLGEEESRHGEGNEKEAALAISEGDRVSFVDRRTEDVRIGEVVKVVGNMADVRTDPDTSRLQSLVTVPISELTSENFAKKDASFEDDTLTAPISDEDADMLLGLDIDKVAKRFDREVGLAHHEYYGTPPMHIMAEKIEADELGMDIFGDDTSSDYSPGERSVSAIAVQHLVEERPRLLADRSNLLMAAAKAYRKALKPVRTKISVEQVNLSRIAAHQVDENLGTMMTGKLEFQVTLASHAHRRRANVTLEMPVVAGEPVEVVTMVTAGGERLPFDLESIDKVMNIRRDAKAVSRGYHGVPQSYHFEY